MGVEAFDEDVELVASSSAMGVNSFPIRCEANVLLADCVKLVLFVVFEVTGTYTVNRLFDEDVLNDCLSDCAAAAVAAAEDVSALQRM